MPQQQRPLPSGGTRFLLYLLMGPLELLGRVCGFYRKRTMWEAPSPAARPQLLHNHVICFGDSLTAGYGAPRGMSYPDFLADLLAPKVEVHNIGRSGDTAADGLARLEQDVMQSDKLPCRVVVGFGGNDLIRKMQIQDTFADLEAIVTTLQNAGCLVILLGLRGSWLFRVDYDLPFRELATRTGCLLVPLSLDGIWGCPWLMADVAHPNQRGYRILAERVAKVLNQS